MSRNGWQIIDHSDPNDDRISKCGQTETVDVKDVPKFVIDTALKASSLIGDGLYGIDIKEKNNNCVVIEINDCVDIDTPYEIKKDDDSVLIEIFKTFKERLEIKKATN
jgi:glutathione synthase/RimK-type ligase-like ATP-grasp enzyme